MPLDTTPHYRGFQSASGGLRERVAGTLVLAFRMCQDLPVLEQSGESGLSLAFTDRAVEAMVDFCATSAPGVHPSSHPEDWAVLCTHDHTITHAHAYFCAHPLSCPCVPSPFLAEVSPGRLEGICLQAQDIVPMGRMLTSLSLLLTLMSLLGLRDAVSWGCCVTCSL